MQATSFRSAFLFAALAAVIVLSTGGCSRSESQVKEKPGHPLTGTVVSVNKERGTLLVQHDAVPGVMPAMTMEFNVSPGDLALAREGMAIRARLVKTPDGKFTLQDVWPADKTKDEQVDAAAKALRQDTIIRGRGAYREIGEDLPDFALYDQDGKVVQAGRFQGKQVVLNFIYTRCPDPRMCPATVQKMTNLQRDARAAGIKNLELVSITLDPEYDTPGVLHQYAAMRSIDTSNYSFLTGPESAIKDLMKQLGVSAFADGPLVKHTLSTVLINEDGRIIHRVDGSQWEPADFLSRLHRPEGKAG